VPTREDVLAIRSIEEAFDLSTHKVRKREVALIRVAAAERLIRLTSHADDAMDDEAIAEEIVLQTILHGRARSKDIDARSGRQIGINFEGDGRSERRIRVKVSWAVRYFVATVHTV
jgi:hypothetical protein